MTGSDDNSLFEDSSSDSEQEESKYRHDELQQVDEHPQIKAEKEDEIEHDVKEPNEATTSTNQDHSNSIDSVKESVQHEEVDEDLPILHYRLYNRPIDSFKIVNMDLTNALTVCSKHFNETENETEKGVDPERVIRWRITDGGEKESNAHIVTFDDGSKYLFIGEKPYRINVINDYSQECRTYLYTSEDKEGLQQCHGAFSEDVKVITNDYVNHKSRNTENKSSVISYVDEDDTFTNRRNTKRNYASVSVLDDDKETREILKRRKQDVDSDQDD